MKDFDPCMAAGMATCHCPDADDVYDAVKGVHVKVSDLTTDRRLSETHKALCDMAAAARKVPAGIGDVHSDAKGSGARFNSGKPDMSLIPLTMLAGFYRPHVAPGSVEAKAVEALEYLGLYQSVQDTAYLFKALEALGADGWRECAHVFDYGKRKYAAWNWAKGMPWSVPIGCAARHLVSVIGGEAADIESLHPHRGHVFCNVVMLLQYSKTYTEGNDLPAKGLL